MYARTHGHTHARTGICKHAHTWKNWKWDEKCFFLQTAACERLNFVCIRSDLSRWWYYRITLREAGAYVFLDVLRQGVSLQWDRGLRVYVRVDAMWQERVSSYPKQVKDMSRRFIVMSVARVCYPSLGSSMLTYLWHLRSVLLPHFWCTLLRSSKSPDRRLPYHVQSSNQEWIGMSLVSAQWWCSLWWTFRTRTRCDNSQALVKNS